jgi:S-adenosylmethionine-diacylglycerol 3-amino-3-carboxypropyl transferase
MLVAGSLEDQRRIFESEIAPVLRSWVLRFASVLPTTMFGLGIPPQQRDEMTVASGENSILDLCVERVRHMTCDFPIEDNYFAWQALSRKYDLENRRAIPDYLKEENYNRLRTRANRVSTIIGPFTDVIREHPRGYFNRFVLLDAQDWMDAAAVRAVWQQILHRAAPGSRIIFRTASAESPLPAKLPSDMLRQLHYDAEASRGFWERDRSSIYGGFHLYVL